MPTPSFAPPRGDPGPTGVTPRSAVAAVGFPAMAQGAAAQMLSMMAQLNWSQWWPAARLEEVALAQVGLLARFAREHVPWYTERLRGIELGGRWDAERLRTLPVLTRRDIQDAGDRLHARAMPPNHGKVGATFTSGSSGTPVHVRKSELQLHVWQAITLREHAWHGRDLRSTLGIVRHLEGDVLAAAQPPDGRVSTSWGGATAAVFPTGPSVLLSIRTPVEDQAAWLLRTDPQILLIYPSALAYLVEHLNDRGLRPSRLAEIRCVSEAVTPALRARVREVLGVPITDMYSTQECGYLALQCPEHEHYHVQAESSWVEVLRDDGSPCAPGEVGRVVATPLHAFAMPLLRYDLGDYAEVGEPCACGRGLPVLRRIVGRERELARLPDGRRLWPVFAHSDFRKVAPIRQYQFRQVAADLIEAHVVADRPLSEDEVGELTRLAIERLGYPFRIAFLAREEIPRGPGGKYADFVCEVRD